MTCAALLFFAKAISASLVPACVAPSSSSFLSVSSSDVCWDQVRVVQITTVNVDSNNREISRFIGRSFALEPSISSCPARLFISENLATYGTKLCELLDLQSAVFHTGICGICR